jgi:uncharacterized membrane protein
MVMDELSPVELLKDESEAKSPPLPATPPETITALVHYYRVSLSTPASHHGVLLFAMLLISLLLFIEARRYRFFDVYRARVRRMERGYFAQVLCPQAPFKVNWATPIADSLRRPAFLMSYRAAVCRRLRRNYCWMYLILLLAWALKISSPVLQPDGSQTRHVRSLSEVATNAALGPVSGWLVFGLVAFFYAAIAYFTLHKEPGEGELAHGEVHV